MLPNYIGIIINHYKDPYEPTSIMESSKFFFLWQTCEFFQFLHSLWCKFGTPHAPMSFLPIHSIKAMFAEIDRMDRGVRGAKPVREVRVDRIPLADNEKNL